MKRLLSLLVLLTTVSWCTWADETITVSANSEDISQALDLKAVATLFGTVKNVEEFETLLNNPDSAFTNLDLNGDGVVDYLRVVETSDNNKHLVVIQAVLAKDVFQDVASIYVEKDETTGQVTTQVIGDEYVYGENYVIEPVYIYRPYIYDWFWDPFWVCWSSPWYWGYYPHWWYGWTCWSYTRYWDHCYHWHHHHPYCSYRYASHPRPYYQDMRRTVSRREYATRHSDRSFATRNQGRSTNARSLDVSRTAATHASRGGVSRQGAVAGRAGQIAPSRRMADNTFGSTGVRRSATASTTRQAATTQRGQQHGTRPQATRKEQGTAARGTTATTTRSTTTTTQRSSASTQRGTATAQRGSSTTQRGSATTQRSSGTTQRSSASTSRTSSPSRSSSASSSRSSSSSSSRSSGSYGGSRSSGSSSSGRSSGGGSFGGGGRSSGGGGSHGGGSHGGGGGRSGGGGPRR